MADRGSHRFPPPNQEFDLWKLLHDAQARWLKPAEICALLNNHKELPLSSDTPSKPASGSLFLFDRTKLRYFRKDGHNWRKKKDLRTVREAHEKLKVGNKDAIHCYYAHGEDNQNFQRRSYWLLEGAYQNIVLVHYREVTEGSRSEFYMPATDSPVFEVEELSQMHLKNAVYAPAASASSALPCSLVSSPSDIFNPSLNSHEETDSGEDFEDFQMPRMEQSQAHRASMLEQITLELGLGSTGSSQENNASSLPSRVNNAGATSNPIHHNIYHSDFALPQLHHQVQFENTNRESISQQLSHNKDLESLENMEMSELLKEIGSFPNLNELSNSDSLDSSSWSSLLESTYKLGDKPVSWPELPYQRIPTQFAKNLEPAPNSTSDSVHPGFVEAPPFRGMERQPDTFLEDNRFADASKKNGGKVEFYGSHLELDPLQSKSANVLGLEQESHSSNLFKSGMVKEESELCQSKPWQQDKEALQQNQQFIHPKQEPVLSDDKPFNIGLELRSIDTELLSPNVSDLMQSMQYDEAKSLPDGWGVTEFEDNIANPLILGSSKHKAYWKGFDQNEIEESGLSQQILLDAGLEQSSAYQKRFKILDFTPEWSYCSDEAKVIVTGIFLDTLNSHSDSRWSCIFGEMPVSAEVLQSGVLRCKAPLHEPGRVSFYVTCNNKTPCSEICEFEFRSKCFHGSVESETDKSLVQQEKDLLLQIRFARLLSMSEDTSSTNYEQEVLEQMEDSANLVDKIGSLVIDDNVWNEIEDLAKGQSQFFKDAKEKLLQALLKFKLQEWLFRRSRHPKGMAILDDYGLGVLHMAAALGYEWAISPILAAGAGINFRDAHGWTALHWAAHCGREKVIASLVAADAAPGAITDPTPEYPKGQTAADLAASSGHGGIAGYLAESSLTTHLSSLKLDESKVDEVLPAVARDQGVEVDSERRSELASFGVTEDQLSLKDTLAAVRNAAQAAARIQAAFRAYSFHKRKETIDSDINEFGMLEEEARAFAAAQTIQRAFRGHHRKLNLAATQIQCKYRSWKGRKDFLLLKHNVVKIQAHVRGHQVRKKYKKILWTVSVLDKVILRWRRKGSGLRGFRGEETIQDEDSDDDDFLKDFRRQKEEAFEEALNRVKVMLQDPKARTQYRRMLEMCQNEKEALTSETFLSDDELMKLLEE